jgi:LPPG:FO 2-phospho-L-lactate transferase
MKIVGLGGGIGAARLWRALLERVDPAEVTIVVNTGDDLWIHGLRVCPDLDTVLYSLTDRQDPVRGWGLRGETWRCMERLRELGSEGWFNLGDADLATHLFRTGALRAGRRLSEVTADLAAALGLRARLLPMSDDEVETHVLTDAGALHYQEFYIARAASDVVAAVEYRGAQAATPAPGVLEAITAADRIIIGPSNPVASIGPILAVPGVRDAIKAATAPVIAVTPIVSGIRITDAGEQRRADSRAALLAALGLPHTARAAAELFTDLLDAFVLDLADRGEPRRQVSGADVLLAHTLVDDHGRFPPGPIREEDLVDLLLGYTNVDFWLEQE